MIALELADHAGLRWAQRQCARHYLRRPVDPRSRPLAYLVRLDAYGGPVVGFLTFGRTESTRCYAGELTYGSLADVAAGRAMYSRWEILSLARVWLDPIVQRGGACFVDNAATQAIGLALRRVGFDYLVAYPPCFLDEPWQIRHIISYCDTRYHNGTLYRAASFRLVRESGHLQTYARAVRSLSPREKEQIVRLATQSARSRRYRAARTVDVIQEALWTT